MKAAASGTHAARASAVPGTQAERASAGRGMQAAHASASAGTQSAPAGGDAADSSFAALLDGLCPDAGGAATPPTADAKDAPADEAAGRKKPVAKADEATPEAFLPMLPPQQQAPAAQALPLLNGAAPDAHEPQVATREAKPRAELPDLQLTAAPEPLQQHATAGAFQALLAAAVPGSAGAPKQEHIASDATATVQGVDLSALAAASQPQQAQQPDAAMPAMPVHQAALPSHPLDAAFAGDLGVEVRWMVESGLQQAELHLHPTDLGPIHIQLSVQQQAAEISLSAAHATTREGLQQALPALREMLAGQGLQLAQAGVSGGQSFAQQQGQQRQAPVREKSTGMQGVGAAVPRSGGVARTRGGLGLLDLYA